MGKSYTAYLSSLLLFGSNGILAALVSLPSLSIVVVRTFLGALFLGVLFAGATALRRRNEADSRAPQSPRTIASLTLFAASGAALGASWIVLFEAYRLVGVGTASLLYYCGPVIVMGITPLVFKERLSAWKLYGFAAVVTGAVLISLQALDGGQNPSGILLGGMAACFYAAMIVFTKKAALLDPDASGQGLRNSFIQLFAGFLVSAGYCATTQGPAALIPAVPPSDIAPLLMLGLANTGMGCLLYFWSIGRLPVQTVAVCGYLEPLSAVVLATLLLGEPMGAAQVLGAVLIIGGAAFCELSGRMRRNFVPKNKRHPVSQVPTVSRRA